MIEQAIRINELAKKIDDKFGEWETKLNEIRNDEKIELERKVKELSENINSETPTGQMNMIENSSMNKRMEDFMERKEREDRKNNIIIKGLVWNETGEILRKKVEDCIKEKIKIRAEVKYARKIRFRNLIMAKIGTFKQKISIMENKKR